MSQQQTITWKNAQSQAVLLCRDLSWLQQCHGTGGDFLSMTTACEEVVPSPSPLGASALAALDGSPGTATGQGLCEAQAEPLSSSSIIKCPF